MKISVIICTYNRAESLKDTLDSLLAQRCDETFEYEIITVDNNSTDKTKELTESYIQKFEGRGRYLFEPKQGKPYALNRGIQESKGEILAFTDDDVIVDTKWLSEIHKNFANPEIGISGGIINPIWQSEKPSWLTEKLYGSLALQNYGDKPFMSSLSNRLPFGASFAFRKNLLQRYGLFDEKLIFAQDTEICLRLLKNKVTFGYNPNIIAYHKIPSERLKKEYFYKWFYRRGKLSQYYKEMPPVKFYHPFGIPLWMILEYIHLAITSLNPFSRESERLYQRCLSFKTLGTMTGRFTT